MFIIKKKNLKKVLHKNYLYNICFIILYILYICMFICIKIKQNFAKLIENKFIKLNCLSFQTALNC